MKRNITFNRRRLASRKCEKMKKEEKIKKIHNLIKAIDEMEGVIIHYAIVKDQMKPLREYLNRLHESFRKENEKK